MSCNNSELCFAKPTNKAFEVLAELYKGLRKPKPVALTSYKHLGMWLRLT